MYGFIKGIEKKPSNRVLRYFFGGKRDEKKNFDVRNGMRCLCLYDGNVALYGMHSDGEAFGEAR